jgi:hypothetical protein
MPNEDKIQEWKQQYGEVYEIASDVDDAGEPMTFYFRKPGWADLSRFAREVAKDMLKATNNLVFGCLLHPSPDVLRKQVEEKPGLILALGAELQKIIGANQDFLSRKL